MAFLFGFHLPSISPWNCLSGCNEGRISLLIFCRVVSCHCLETMVLVNSFKKKKRILSPLIIWWCDANILTFNTRLFPVRCRLSKISTFSKYTLCPGTNDSFCNQLYVLLSFTHHTQSGVEPDPHGTLHYFVTSNILALHTAQAYDRAL